MKKTIITILIAIMCFFDIVPVQASAAQSSTLALTSEPMTATAQAENAEENYYMQLALKKYDVMTMHNLTGVASDFFSIPMRKFSNINTYYDIVCDIEIQFLFENEADNFILVIPSKIQARTWWMIPATVEVKFVENYELQINAEHYQKLKSEQPYYRVMLRGSDKTYTILQCGEEERHGAFVGGYSIGTVWHNSYIKVFDNDYTMTNVPLTNNYIVPKGEIEQPIYPDPDDPHDIVEPGEYISFWKKAFNWIQSGITGNDTIKKALSWVVVVLLVMCILTAISFIFKWFKYVFGK